MSFQGKAEELRQSSQIYDRSDLAGLFQRKCAG